MPVAVEFDESWVTSVDSSALAQEWRAHLKGLRHAALVSTRKEGAHVFYRLAGYAAGHIPGAISMPYEEIEQRFSELPSDGEIVAYCRGPYCIYAVRAVEALRRGGFQARRLEDGIPDWSLRGLPVAVGAAPKSNE